MVHNVPMEKSESYQANIEAIANYLRSGESTEETHRLGFEIEHFVVDAQTNALVPYSSDDTTDGRPGVEDVLHGLEPLYEGDMHTVDTEGRERVIGLARKGAPLTIEPGAQVEVSIGPACNVGDLERVYKAFRSEIDNVLEGMGYKLVTLGYHPSACARDIPLIPKHRYAMMNEHFTKTGRHGICMMRGSASTQVSIDFDDEADCIAKMRVASAIGPLIYFLCDNAPVFEGLRVGRLEPGFSGDAFSASRLKVPMRMARARIWGDVDPDRGMVAPTLFEPGPAYSSYARMLMDRPPILTLSDPHDDSTAVYHGFERARDIYAGHLLTVEEIEHLLSMFFFDVRLKKYIEIRMADSMPSAYALSYAAFIKGIFYNDVAIERLCGLIERVRLEDTRAVVRRLRSFGYDAQVYGRPAREWFDELLDLAESGLKAQAQDAPAGVCPAADDTAYLESLAGLVRDRTTVLEALHG